ncbi:MAG: sporulation integral membrane protein YtvI [Clostridiales bacterium]|jgi:sporulation integral membrane protein YtvI|nr:sporulation integral membrane protein YtvI [Clostridiales bacterium]
MRQYYSENKEKIDRILFIALVTLTVYLFFTVFFVYLAPFFVGLVVALIMEPLNKFLTEKIGFLRWVSSLICLFLFIGILSSLGVWLFNTLGQQAAAFVEDAPAHIEEITGRLDEANVWLQRIAAYLPEGWYIPNVEEMLPTVAAMFFGDGMRETGLRAIENVSEYAISIILGLVAAYFFMSDGKRIYNFIKESSPQWFVRQARYVKAGLKRALSGYFRAQAIIMVIVGAISVAGLMFIGSPYALMLGLLFAVLDFLPIFGTGLVMIPWIIISLIMGNMGQTIGLAIIYAIITIARQVMQPKILGTQMGAHPLASLMAIYIGLRIFGILGLLIGPALLMIFVAMFEPETDGGNEDVQHGRKKRKSNFNFRRKK